LVMVISFYVVCSKDQCFIYLKAHMFTMSTFFQITNIPSNQPFTDLQQS